MEAPLFGDAVDQVIGWLNTRLIAAGETARCRTDVPNPRPAELVIVDLTGGARETEATEGAQITVDAWAQTTERAHDLSQLCLAYIYAMVGVVVAGRQVYRVQRFGGPFRNPDPVSDQERFTFTVSVSVRYASLVS